ncbi:1-phosphatidylinositol 4,5-bisphosphate phosphodiesterase gamma-1-like, partial [Sinocyclocheilus rhinocerous]|uniref:1-phosphatidylinositol 4,5-bisphosphate phosphodiesterase gamma-1-like n=1 Tax=Sinocyclocheilus rhinocerous TaxID=307959 RepID=UPI0007B79C93
HAGVLRSVHSATSDEEMVMWVKGLTWLVSDTLRSPTPLQIERWLRKQFYAVDRSREDRISCKDLKSMLCQVNYRVPNMRFLREKLPDGELRNGDVSYSHFAQLYRSLMFDAQKSMEIPLLQRLIERPEQKISLEDFQNFLIEHQKELWATDNNKVQEFMLHYLKDPLREIEQPYFHQDEFLTYLFSKENTIWDVQLDQVRPEDMNNPLSHYWISSSHNTYLTGDQFSSESSLEAYARCLRMGCRCIELDCWDGPDGMPVIYHGHTLTTKIKFNDVLSTIKEHAFVTSDYPIILSIEDHCSIVQQRNMATYFKKVFGEMLLTKAVDISADGLPSPNQLKRKILIKHKKLAEGSAYEEVSSSTPYSENDISNSIKNGILYLEDPINHEWYPHFFVLTSNKIYYSEETSSNQGNEDEEEHREVRKTQSQEYKYWWKGDYGGKKQLWFPANYVEEISPTAAEPDRSATENSPLGDLLRGSVDVSSCQIVVRPEGKGSRQFVFSLVPVASPRTGPVLDIAASSQEELKDWVMKIREVTMTSEAKLEEGKMMERRKKIALELSDLVIYCRPVPFDEDKIGTERACFRDMSSFPETKAEKYVNRIKGKKFLQYNRLQLSRIYPRGQRLDSSNYDPLPMWLCGSQLVALNFQTADKPMQMNQALFMLNGRSGYVLQPSIMRDDTFDPFDRHSLRGVEPITVCIEVLGARHLPKHGRGIVCPLIEIEVCGAEYDNAKQRTDSEADNGLNPTWPRKPFRFTVCNPSFAFLRFVVYEIDMFNDQNFLAQATFPISCLKTGYRSVPLKNSYSEDLELASLLVHMDIVRGRHENGEMLSPFSAAGAIAMQVGRERTGDTSSVSSTSPLPSSPGQALGYHGREGSFEARYQSPLEDFRVSQETLLDHESRRLRRARVSADNRA